MNIFTKAVLLSLSLFVATGCASRLPMPEGIQEISTSDYERLINQKTQKVEIYEGLHNKLTVQATRLDSLMTEGTLSHSARLSQWLEPKYREERAKIINKHAESTEFFVSFYTPEKKHAELSSSKNLWKIFLDVNGQRYEGKATKVKQLLSEIQALYPHHNRWSTPFIVSFPVATALSENKPATLTFTGAVGSAQVQFP